jgi:hypothetical protein
MFGIIKDNKVVIQDVDRSKLENTISICMPQYVQEDIVSLEEVSLVEGYDGCMYVEGHAPIEPKELVEKRLKSQITSLESKQPRALRELALNPNDADAKVRLQDIESEITTLREQIEEIL